MNSTSLPVHHSSEIQKLGWIHTSDRYKAYSAILAAEKYAQQLVDNASTIKRKADRDYAMEFGKDKLISARVAGRFFIEFEEQSTLFNTTPVETLVRSFLSAPQNHDVIIDTGRDLRDNFIRIFRSFTVPYWLRLSPPSLPSFDSCTSSRNKALARDGYRCIVTGTFDETSLGACPDLPDASQVESSSIEVAQILHESTVQGIGPGSTDEIEISRDYGKAYDTASAVSILQSFGLSTFADNLGQTGGVDQVCNLISLTHDLHNDFDRCNVWFEATEKPHRYRVCTRYEGRMRSIRRLFIGEDRKVEGAPMFVEFDSQNKDAPPPDPLLLALHALCARVAHASGATEFFNRLDTEMEAGEILTSDGSSGPLNHLLSPYSARIPVGA